MCVDGDSCGVGVVAFDRGRLCVCVYVVTFGPCSVRFDGIIWIANFITVQTYAYAG